MEGGSLEQMMQQHTRDGCRDEGFLREVCHNVLKVSRMQECLWKKEEGE